MQRTIAFDMDGVIVDFCTPWLAWYNEKWGDNLTEDQLKGYNFSKQTKAGDAMNDFLYTPTTYDNVKAFPGMLELMQKLKDDGHRVIIATKASHNGTMVETKCAWFKKHASFIKPEDIVIVQDKSLVRADVLIDDDPRNLEAFPEGRILYLHSYNREYQSEASASWGRVSNAAELEQYLYSTLLAS